MGRARFVELARQEMERDLARRVRRRPSRESLVATAVLLAVLAATLVAWDFPGVLRARAENIHAGSSPTAVVGTGFPLLRTRSVHSVTPSWRQSFDTRAPLGLARDSDGGGESVGRYAVNVGDIAMAGTPEDGLVYYETLRHEYGHALMEDAFLDYDYGRPPLAEYLMTIRSQLAIDLDKESPRWLAEAVLPERLVPSYDAYLATGEGLAYGDEHYDSCFAEFFAESFSRYVGTRVPLVLDNMEISVSGGGYPEADAAIEAISREQVSRAGGSPTAPDGRVSPLGAGTD